MSRMSLLSSPLLLGFEDMERLIDRVGKGGDAYPPYNIERIAANGAGQWRSSVRARGSPAHHAGGSRFQARSAGDHARGQPARHPRPPRGRQGARVYPPRHCRTPIQPLVRAGRGHRGEIGRSQGRPLVHRSRPARARSPRAQDRDRCRPGPESFRPQRLWTELREDRSKSGRYWGSATRAQASPRGLS